MRIEMIAGVLAGVLLSSSSTAATDDAALKARVDAVLARPPLVDGHNDLPWEIRTRFGSKLSTIDLAKDTSALPHPDGPPLMTDIPRLRAGHVGGQFWSVWVPADVTGPKAVEMTIEQIDLVKRMV